MKVKYSTKSGETKITLSDTETRQFLSMQAAVNVVREAIKGAAFGEFQAAPISEVQP